MGKKENLLTEEQLKEKYGTVKEIIAGPYKAYFKKPSLVHWRFAMQALNKSETAFKISLTKNCFVQGDKELISEDYIKDVAEFVDEFVSYEEAEIEKQGNAYKVSILGKYCILRPVSVEIKTTAERNNPDNDPFKTRQNMLDMMWIEGDDCIKSSKLLDLEYHMPVLKVLDDLRQKHMISIKNV